MDISKIQLPDGNTYQISKAIPMGKVDSTSTSTAYTATIDGISEYKNGVCCYLTNGVVTSEANFTININGLGAKPVYSSLASATRSTTIFNVNYTMLFIYNESRVSGGCFDVFYGYDSNTNTIGYQVRTNSSSLPVSGATYRYRLLFTSADGKSYVPANTSSSTNATASRAVNQAKIDPFGRIVYYSYTTAVSANARPGATYLWEQYVLSLGYSFNRTGSALTLTSWAPVYVKCAPQDDGSAIIDSTTPYVQALPTSEDGKIYIFLGIAYSATNIELTLEHPVYYFKDGAIRQWSNSYVPGKVSAFENDRNYIDLQTASELVTYEPTLTSGTPIGTLTTDGIAQVLYAPTPSTSEDNVIIVNVTLSGVSSGTSDITSQKIFEETIAGKLCVVKCNLGVTFMMAPLSLVYEADGYVAIFTYEDQSNGMYKYCTMTIVGNIATLVFKDGYLSSDDFAMQSNFESGTEIGVIQVGTTPAVHFYTPTIPTNISSFTNDSGYITGISSSDVTSALGYTPYNSTNPNGYITSSSLSNYYTKSEIDAMLVDGDSTSY